MTDKYIDLGPQIAEGTQRPLTSLAHERQLEALKWLDEHPDQVPGRSITRSEMRERMNENFTTKVRSIDVEAYTESLGRIVVPDPEPMPTIEFARDIMRFESGDPDTKSVPHWAVNMASYLMDAGYVKAPEGEGE